MPVSSQEDRRYRITITYQYCRNTNSKNQVPVCEAFLFDKLSSQNLPGIIAQINALMFEHIV